MNARRADATVIFNGTDITKDILPYLLSLTYTDNEEDESDDLQIKIQDRDGKWLEWWLAEAITSSAAKGAAATSTGSGTGTGTDYSVTAPSGLNLRTGPGMGNSIITAFPYGTSVKVSDSSGDWYKVTVGGSEGYMHKSWLQPSGAAGNSAVSDTVNGTLNGTLNGTDVSSYPTLRFGSQGDYVKTMQSALVSHGQSLPKYGVDGYFGSETKAAVVAFQQSAGLSADGICGPLTWAALLGSSGSGTGIGTGSGAAFCISATIIRYDWYGTEGEGSACDGLNCGQFELDSVDASSPPSTVTIKATALPYTSKVRQTKKTRAWENMRLSGIAGQIASEAGMACVFESPTDPKYDRMEQYRESDIAFLKRLAHASGVSLKATNNQLVLFSQAEYEGKDPVLVLTKGKGYEKYSLSTGEAGTKYASCRVSYPTPSGILYEATAKAEDEEDDSESTESSKSSEKEEGQQLEISERCDSVADALQKAEMYLRLYNKYAKTATFTLPGDTSLVAGKTATLSGFGYWDGKYMIKKAVHTLGSSGYTTAVTLRNII